MTIEDYLDRNYEGRPGTDTLSDEALLEELRDLIEEVPELSGMISDARRPLGQRRPRPEEAVVLQRQLEAARRRASAIWEEFNNRFGHPPRR